MALTNRDKDQSEQRDVFTVQLGAVPTGVTLPLLVVPYPCQVVGIDETMVGLSGAPVHSINVHRFIVGTGITAISLSATLTPVAYGTSGIQAYSTASFGVTTLAQGSTVVANLYTNDVLVLNSGVANTAAVNPVVTIVIKALQDIKTHFGL